MDLSDLSICYQCGGPLFLASGPGRTTEHRGETYALPDDLAILTCQDCGAEWTDGATEEAIERAIRAQQNEKTPEPA